MNKTFFMLIKVNLNLTKLYEFYFRHINILQYQIYFSCVKINKYIYNIS